MKRCAMWVLALTAGIMVLFTANALAQQASSTNYSVDEVFFGSGGELEACSTNYCSKQAAGELAQGETKSSNYSAQAGFNTNRQEYLEFGVTANSTDVGYLGTTYTRTATGNFYVKAYQSSGFIVVNAGDGPKTTTVVPHIMTSPSSPTASAVGTEQFGMNLRANTSPATMGADPVQVPDSTFSFATVATGYNTVNQYKYVKGDTIVQSTQSSGETDFTASYIFNINNVTQAGTYNFDHDMVAVATY